MQVSLSRSLSCRLTSSYYSYDEELTLTVFPNLKIRVPVLWHSAPAQNYPNETEWQLQEGDFSNVTKYDQILYLGRPFLSSIYLFVDNDSQTFALWEAQPNMTQDLVSVGLPVCSSLAASPSLPTVPSTIPSYGPSKGAIAGASVGGLFAIVTIIGAIILLVRTHRRKQGQQSQANDGDQRSSRWWAKAEMASDQHPPLEMPVSRDPGYSLAPYELPVPGEIRHTRNLQEMPTELTQGMPTEGA